ncbi:MAG: iron-sulfur cluster assembly scaffold protein [Deltaproteobacteria bacterium]|nr:iron-sulfur cluster assembly scaffold protein [Deltaproteobacteria bacterium]
MDRKDLYRQDLGPEEPIGYIVYNKVILDHFKNPRHAGEIEDPDGVALVGDPDCGDHIQLYIKIEDDKIADIKYKVFGCAAAIATTSILSELAMGKDLDDALQITDDDVIEAAGGVPAKKTHCSLLGVVGLHAAIADYLMRAEKGGR